MQIYLFGSRIMRTEEIANATSLKYVRLKVYT